MKFYPMPLQLDEEDKIVGGFFSLRQIIFIVAGAMFGVIIVGTAARLLGWEVSIILGVFPVAAGFFAALYKCDGITFDRLIIYFLTYYFKSKQYTWYGLNNVSAENEKKGAVDGEKESKQQG
ncbi:MAG: PrgI family protein [Thermoanaerobacteraceae bacterium]|nr:PrgI family protein [Thermoanaerobacteraceae bacterium]